MNIQESLDTILATNTKFADQFYMNFAADHPSAFEHFAGVEMGHQVHLLTTGLILIVKEYANPNEAVKYYLRLLGTRHSRKGIERASYALWADSMLKTLSEFHDADWNEDLAKEWRDAIDIAIDQMIIGYDDPQHV